MASVFHLSCIRNVNTLRKHKNGKKNGQERLPEGLPRRKQQRRPHEGNEGHGQLWANVVLSWVGWPSVWPNGIRPALPKALGTCAKVARQLKSIGKVSQISNIFTSSKLSINLIFTQFLYTNKLCLLRTKCLTLGEVLIFKWGRNFPFSPGFSVSNLESSWFP